MKLLKYAAAALFASSVAANVTVELKAQWQSDFLLELVETLSTEHTYFDFINHIAEQVEDGANYTDKEWYDNLTAFAASKSEISDFQKSLTDAALAFRRESPLIETFYQLGDSQESECDIFFTYNGKKYCDSNDLFTLKTTKMPKNPSVYFFDHVARSVQANKHLKNIPVTVLYADLRSPEFPLFHKILYQEAQDGKMVYILRYRRSDRSERVTMTGYGAELSLKKTDYLVLDDDANTEKLTDNKNPVYTKRELQNMGLNAAQFVLNHRKDPEAALKALKEVSFDFPLLSSSLNNTKPVKGFQKALQENTAAGDFMPGANQMFVNGALLSTSASNLQSLFDLVALEHSRLEVLAKTLKGAISAEQLASILNDYPLQHALESQPQRIDYRDADALLWLNNLATDIQYQEWPRSVASLLQNQINLAHNAQTVVMPFNMDDFADVKVDKETGELINMHPINRGKLTVLFTMLQRSMPIQFGVVPYGSTLKGKKLSQYLHYLARNVDATASLRFLFALGAGTPVEEIFTQIPAEITQESVDEALKEESYEPYVTASREWMKKLGMNEAQTQEPAFVMNGIVMPFSEEWQNLVGARFQQDLPEMLKLVQKQIIKVSKEAPVGEDDEDEDDENAGNPVDKYFANHEIKDLLVEGSPTRRNLILSPASFTNLQYLESDLNLKDVSTATIAGTTASIFSNSILAGNFASTQFVSQLLALIEAQQEEKDRFAFRTQFVHIGQTDSAKGQVINGVVQKLTELAGEEQVSLLKDALAYLEGDNASFSAKKVPFDKTITASEEVKYLKQFKTTESSTLLIIDGLVNDISSKAMLLDKSEVIALYEREAVRRLELTSVALSDLKLLTKSVENNLDLAKVHIPLAKIFYGDATEQESTLYDVRAFHHIRWNKDVSSFVLGDESTSLVKIVAAVDVLSDGGQRLVSQIEAISKVTGVSVRVFPSPKAPDARQEPTLPLKRFYRAHNSVVPEFDAEGAHKVPNLNFEGLPAQNLLTFGLDAPSSWIAMPADNTHDLDNILLEEDSEDFVDASYSLQNILIEGSIIDITKNSYAPGTDLLLKSTLTGESSDTLVMSNLGYFQLQAGPGLWELNLGPSASDVYETEHEVIIPVTDVLGPHISLSMERKKGKENVVVGASQDKAKLWSKLKKSTGVSTKKQADINIFTVASGHLYERFLSIMTASVMAHTDHTVKFWLIENFLSASFKAFLPHLAAHYGFEYELVTYQWPHWLRGQTEKQRQIWGYKILFLDVLFPQDLERVIFIDSDQIVRTDLYELVEMDLEGAPYGFTPMCDSRKEMDGFRFWKQGYWDTFLGDDLVYHISALFVVDLKVFRAQQIGDRLRVHYHQLSADPASLSNLDQDLPNNLQRQVPIFSLPQDWLWCETWCSDESLKTAKTIDMCNNPLTKEPKLDRARRQVPEWTKYDDEIRKLRKEAEGIEGKKKEEEERAGPVEVEVEIDEPEADLHDEL
uniref:UDP-Glc:glycoprotein glucosyltransferase n=1 Tax=Yarrowia lipolytica TaxID=4952 RepID=Q873M5_YARLL|nr:UDP-Glc:glycoprotein glucosyltransferase precursor [Yarrowia lipolytica]